MNPDMGFDADRYRKLLTEATDERRDWHQSNCPSKSEPRSG